MGVVSELIACFARRPIFGYSGMAMRSWRSRSSASSCGRTTCLPPGISIYSGDRVLADDVLRRGAVGDQGVQLDGQPAQGIDQFRRADALCIGFCAAVHDRRADRSDGCDIGARRAPARYLFRHRAFPLHHGRRHRQRVLRRAALLVAEDHRPLLSRDMGALRRDPDLRRLQPDLLPAIHPRLSRDAAALLHLSAGVAGVERAVVGRRLDPCRRLSAAAVLSRLVADLGKTRRRQPVASHRSGMGDRRRRRRRTISTAPRW